MRLENRSKTVAFFVGLNDLLLVHMREALVLFGSGVRVLVVEAYTRGYAAGFKAGRE